MAIHAEYSLQLIVESLFLLRGKDNSETMASSLLLICVKDAPAIMMVTHADYSLQLIGESLFTGAKQVASATIPNESFKLIDVSKTTLHFREDCGMFCEGEWEQKRRFNGHAGIIGLVGFVGLVDIGGLDIVGQHTGIDLVGHHTGIGPVGCTSPNGLNLVIGHVGLINCIGLNGHIRCNSLISHMGLVGHTGLARASIISLLGRIVGRYGLIGISGFGFVLGVISHVNSFSLDGLKHIDPVSHHISLAGHIRDMGLVGFIGLGISFIGLGVGYTGLVGLIKLVELISFIGLVGLVDLGGISLVSLMGLIGGHISHGLGLVGLIGLNGCIGLNSHNDIVGLINSMEFEIPCYSFVREGWLWCVRRLCSLGRLDSDFFFQHALQYAKQLFYSRIPQMTKYFIMRECEDSYTESLCCDSAFAHKKKFYIFKFPKRYWRSLEERSHNLTLFNFSFLDSFKLS